MSVWVCLLWAQLGSSPVQEALRGDDGWTAERVARRVLDVSHQLDAAEAGLRAATARVKEARTAVLPRIQLLARYTRLTPIDNDPLVSLPGGGASAQALAAQVDDPEARALWQTQLSVLEESVIQIPENQGAFVVSLAYPVSPLFLEILPAVRAQVGVEAARRFEVEVAALDVELQAVELYFLHARARAAAAVAEQAVVEANQNVERARARLAQGLSNRPEVLRFEARLAEAQGVRAERQADVQATAVGLSVLLDLGSEVRLGVTESLETTPPSRYEGTAAELAERAHRVRPALRVLSMLEQTRVQQARARQGAAFPELSVQLEANAARPNALYVPPGDEFRTNGAASVVLHWSVDGAIAASQGARALRAEAAQLRAQLETLRDTVHIEVARTKARYGASLLRLGSAKAQLAAAQEAYRARARAYQLGVEEGTELLGASLDLDRARLAVVDAGVEVRIRDAQLLRAVGESRLAELP